MYIKIIEIILIQLMQASNSRIYLESKAVKLFFTIIYINIIIINYYLF